MHRFKSRTRIVSAILIAIMLIPAQFVVGASNSKKKVTLNKKLNTVKSQIVDVKSLLHQKKVQAKNVTAQLVVTQRKLSDLQERVNDNKLKLQSSQRRLKVIQRRLNINQRQIQRRGTLLSRRLVSIYQGSDIAYTDVLLGSQNMQTFLSRKYYVKKIVTSDVNLIKEFQRVRKQIEDDKKAQSKEVRRIAALQVSYNRDRDEVSTLVQNKQSELDVIEHNVDAYEQALRELEAQSRSIENAIVRLQSTPQGRKRYAQKFTGSLGLPVNGRITCRFGYRIHPITKVHSLHTGVDIACPMGSSVHSAAKGTVILAGWNGPYGNAVVIDHGGGVTTLYGHNSRLLVRVGQDVSKGQVIAKSGSTGWSTGPHCHFEKRVNGRPVNPL